LVTGAAVGGDGEEVGSVGCGDEGVIDGTGVGALVLDFAFVRED
jgi:hypothetical protein